MKDNQGLSLFELLVVLTVILVLVVIFMLSYNHLVITTKISRVKEEHVMVVRALNNYHVDYDSFPSTFRGLTALSAPTAYLGTIPKDPFSPATEHSNYLYIEEPLDGINFIIISRGPDQDSDLAEMVQTFQAAANNAPYAEEPAQEIFILQSYLREKIYDPTNGVNSDGDIVYIGRR
jgi:prepilin-type N-terminal cleavage/methylation domain-containing protein